MAETSTSPSQASKSRDDVNRSTTNVNPPDEYTPQWGRWTRHLITVLLIILGLFALTLLAPVIQMLTLAFLLAFVMFAPARSLNRILRIPYALSVTLVYLSLIIIIIGGIVLVIPAAVDGVRSLSNSLQEGLVELEDELQPYLQEGVNTIDVFGVSVDLQFILDPVRQTLGALNQINQAEAGLEGTVPEGTTPEGTTPEATPAAPEANDTNTTRPSVDLGASDLRTLINSLFSVAGTVTETLTGAVTGITGFFASVLLALFVSFLVLLDIPTTTRTLDKWIPDAYNREYALLAHKLVRIWNGFFKGQVIIGVMIGLLTWVQLQVMGVGNAALLAVIIGTISLIPTIGGFIALIPLSIIPLLNGSNSEVFSAMPNGLFALLVVIVNLFISQLIWNIIAPKILGDVLDLPIAVIIVGVFIGAAVGGVLGAFLVAPIMSSIRILLAYVIAKINMRDPFPGQAAPFEFGQASFTRQSSANEAVNSSMARGGETQA